MLFRIRQGRSSIKKIFGFFLIFIGFGLIAGLAFPALSDSLNSGRVKPQSKVDFPFLKTEQSKLVLVYFGYVGCTRVCEPALKDIAQISMLSKKQKFKHEPAILFVNLTPAVDGSSVKSWVKYFSPHFKAYAPNADEIKQMVQALSLVYTELDSEAEHMPYLYLMQKTATGYEVVYIYTSSPYNRNLILEDIGALQ